MARSGSIPIDAELNVSSINVDPKVQRELEDIGKKVNALAKRHGFGNIEKMVTSAQAAGYSKAMAVTYTQRLIESSRGKKLDLAQQAGLRYEATKVFSKQDATVKQAKAEEKRRTREAAEIQAEVQRNKFLMYGSLPQLKDKYASTMLRMEALKSRGFAEDSPEYKKAQEEADALDAHITTLEGEQQATEQNTSALLALANTMRLTGRIISGIWDKGTPVTSLYENIKGSLGSIGTMVGSAFGPIGAAVGGGIGSLISGIADFIHGAWRQTTERALSIRQRRSLLGAGWNHNFAENMQAYGIGQDALAGMAEHSRYFRVNAAFGDISEQQMLGHSILRNYHAAVMRGEDTIGQVQALRDDYDALGQDMFYTGLKKTGLSTELMQLPQLSTEMMADILNGQSVRDQEIADIANNVKMIASWGSRGMLDVYGNRLASYATYSATGDEIKRAEIERARQDDRIIASSGYIKVSDWGIGSRELSEFRKERGLTGKDPVWYSLKGGKLTYQAEEDFAKTDPILYGAIKRRDSERFGSDKPTRIEIENTVNLDGTQIDQNKVTKEAVLVGGQSMVR